MAHDRKHGSESFWVKGEGLLVTGGGGRDGDAPDPMDEENPGAVTPQPLAAGAIPPFRFIRVGPKSRKTPLSRALLGALAEAMVEGPEGPDGTIPAGYTYLGQFLDHDLTMDRTMGRLGDEVDLADLRQGRSPSLDLDSLYGAGPDDEQDETFFQADGLHLRLGRSGGFDGRDLPRAGTGGPAARRKAVIPDPRNDENLAIAQTHVAMMNFHNQVVDRQPASVKQMSNRRRFRLARRRVTLHYQWLVRHDYLPRICDPKVVSDVFTRGRKLVEPDADPLSVPGMPLEFSVAAFRLGHAMVRRDYNWNAVFSGTSGRLLDLFTFSATGGNLGSDDHLTEVWLADWRRLYDFPAGGAPRLDGPGRLNRASRIDTQVTRPLSTLRPKIFGGGSNVPNLPRNLAFRNLMRAAMVDLATGQEMAALLRRRGVAVTTLTKRQLLQGNGGVDLSSLTKPQRDALAARTPLWFYVLREAELNNGRLTGVGARIVAETFHRAMEGSRVSLLRHPDFTPSLGPRKGTFEMTDLLRFTYGSTRRGLAPVG